MEKFKEGVIEKLGYYVYRLIDPRDGHTFYIGMGENDRVFDHVRGVLKSDEDQDETSHKLDIKFALIQEIIRQDQEPIHIIHRHGMDKQTAEQVESALIDAFMSLTNKIKGHGSQYGPANVDQLNERYSQKVETFNLHQTPDPDCPVIVIKIKEKRLKLVNSDTYEAVRSSWKMSVKRLDTINASPHLVLAVKDTKCVGVYEVSTNAWIKDHSSSVDDPRYEFDGKPAAEDIRKRYIRKRFLNKKGDVDRGRNPIRYFGFRPNFTR